MNEFEEREITRKTLEAVYQRLRDEGIFIEDDGLREDDDVSYDVLKKMLAEPTEFYINDDGELVCQIDGEECVLDPKRDNIKELMKQEEKLLSVLPSVKWDIYQDGFKRKQQESVAIYKVIVADVALGGVYRSSIEQIIKDYNFKDLCTEGQDGQTFVSLLKRIEQDAGSVTKFLLSCCSIVLSSKKQAGEKEFIGILPETESNWLEKVLEDIGILEAETSELLEKAESKLKRLSLIDEKDRKVRALIEKEVEKSPRRDIILKIAKLTSDNLPAKRKIKIKEAARLECEKLFDKRTISSEDSYTKILQKVSRRAIKQAVRDMRREKFKDVMDPDNDILNILPKT